MADDPVRELSDDECWAALRDAPIGRIALAVAHEVDVFPINFIVHEGALCFRTAPGTKLLELSINDHVALEVDGFTDAAAWSVVVKGRAERVEAQAEIDELEGLGLVPWIPTLKYRWVRIRPETVSGRGFRRAPEPDRG